MRYYLYDPAAKRDVREFGRAGDAAPSISERAALRVRVDPLDNSTNVWIKFAKKDGTPVWQNTIWQAPFISAAPLGMDTAEIRAKRQTGLYETILLSAVTPPIEPPPPPTPAPPPWTGSFDVPFAGTMAPAAIYADARPIIRQLPESERALWNLEWACGADRMEGYIACFLAARGGEHALTLTATHAQSGRTWTDTRKLTVADDKRPRLAWRAGLDLNQAGAAYVVPAGVHDVSANNRISGSGVALIGEPGAAIRTTAPVGTILNPYAPGIVISGIALDTSYGVPARASRSNGVRARRESPGLAVVGCTMNQLAYGVIADPGSRCYAVLNCRAPLNTNGLRWYLLWAEGECAVMAGCFVQNSIDAHCMRSGGGYGVTLYDNDLWNLDNRAASVPQDYANNCLTLHVYEYFYTARNRCRTNPSVGDWGGNVELGPLGAADGFTKPDWRTQRLRYFVSRGDSVDRQIHLAHGCEHGRIDGARARRIAIDPYNSGYSRGNRDVLIARCAVRDKVYVPADAAQAGVRVVEPGTF